MSASALLGVMAFSLHTNESEHPMKKYRGDEVALKPLY